MTFNFIIRFPGKVKFGMSYALSFDKSSINLTIPLLYEMSPLR